MLFDFDIKIINETFNLKATKIAELESLRHADKLSPGILEGEHMLFDIKIKIINETFRLKGEYAQSRDYKIAFTTLPGQCKYQADGGGEWYPLSDFARLAIQNQKHDKICELIKEQLAYEKKAAMQRESV